MLINCSAYKNGLKVRDLSIAEISETLKEDAVFVWVALKDPTHEEILAMQQEFNLHPLAVDDVFSESQRTKIEEYGETVFAVALAPTNSLSSLEWGKVSLFVGQKFVLSVRQNIEKGFTDVRARCETEPHLLSYGSGFVFYAILDNIVDRYFPVVEQLENQLEVIESKIFKLESAKAHIESIYVLKEKTMSFRNTAQPLLDALDKLHGGRVPKVCLGMQEYFRDVYDHLYRVERGADSIREMLVTAIQVNLALISLNETQVSKRLASWAAILAVPTMIAGIYGMNFKHMPELEYEWAYPAVLIFMFSIDIYLLYRFKKASWI